MAAFQSFLKSTYLIRASAIDGEGEDEEIDKSSPHSFSLILFTFLTLNDSKTGRISKGNESACLRSLE